MSLPSLVQYATPAEYKQHYENNYCRKKIITFDGIRVYFRTTKFGHVFYESTARDGKKDAFSKERAERIDWIRVTLENPNADIYTGWNKNKKEYDLSRRVTVLYEDFVVVIEIKKVGDDGKILTAEFITAYVANNSINRIRKSPRWHIKNNGR